MKEFSDVFGCLVMDDSKGRYSKKRRRLWKDWDKEGCSEKYVCIYGKCLKGKDVK